MSRTFRTLAVAAAVILVGAGLFIWGPSVTKTTNAATVTPAFVQERDNQIGSGTSDSLAFSKANVAGNLIVAYVVWDNSGTVTVTDSKGNVYAPAGSQAKFSGDKANTEIFYAKNIGAGANTVTAKFSTAIKSYGLLYIHEYSGLNTTAPLDVTAGNTGTSAGMSSGSSTISNSNDLLFGGGESVANINKAGPGYTARSFASGNITEDRVLTSGGLYSAAATQNGSGWIMQMAAFKAASTGTPDTTPPSVPTNLAVTGMTTSTASLSWTASTDNVGVAGYKIYRAGVQVGTSTTTTFINTGLAASMTYSYTVAAYDAAGNVSAQTGAVIAVTKAIVDTTPPSVPKNLIASNVATSSAAFSWTASTDNVGVTGYKIYRGGVQIATTPTVGFADSGLAPGTSYTYAVAAFDAAGNVSGLSSSTVIITQTIPDTTPPSVPTGLTQGTVTTSTVAFSWTASTDNVGVVGYDIYRNGVQAGITSSTFFTDLGLLANTSYSYTVAAYDAANNLSGQSSPLLVATLPTPPDTTPPSVPTNVSAIAISQSQVNVSWTASTDNVGVVAYQVFRDGIQVATTTSVVYQDSGLTASTTYGYTVDALDAAGNVSQQSPMSSATTLAPPDATPPSVPTDLAATPASQTEIDLSWTASTDNVGVTGYEVFNNGNQIGTTTATTFANVGLAASTTYSYTVAAYDAAGNVSAQTSPVLTTTLPTPPDTTPPSVPTGVSAYGVSSTQADIFWNPSTDNVGVAGYQVFRDGSQVGVSTSTFYIDTGLIASTTYGYTVTAYDGAGNVSGVSTIAYATTFTPPDTTAPSMPTGLGTVSPSDTEIDLSWTASTDNVGVIGYEVFKNGTQIATTTATTFASTGLMPSSTYTYAVAAYDAAGNISAQSSPIIGTSLPDTTPPTVPKGLTATAPSSTYVTLSWATSTDNIGVAGYNIYRNGVLDGTVPAIVTIDTDTNLTPSTTYTYNVAAFDAAGNVSGLSSSTVVTTQPAQVNSTTTTYTTNFPATENPISENGHWVNGGQSPALNWTNAQTTPGEAFGTMPPATGNDDDSTALLTGTWGPNQTVTATVHAVGGYANGQEVELRLRSAFGAQSATGYELDIAAGYIAIVRWDGPLNSFTVLSSNTSANWNLSGATVKGTIVGNAISVYVNGVVEGVATDSTYATGNPGMGFFISSGGDSTKSDMGFTSFTATANYQGADLTPPTVPTGLVASSTGATQVYVSWNPSTDNVGVAGYNLYRNGAFDGSVPANITATTDVGLTASTLYTYNVSAFDAAGNTSALSASSTTMTQSGGGGGGGGSTSTPAWAYVQNASRNSGAGTNALAFASANKAGDLIVVEDDWLSASNFTSITDSQGNVYTQIGTEQSSTGVGVKSRMFYAKNIKAGANTVTAVVTGAPAYHELYIQEYSGLSTSSPLDVYSAHVGTGSTFTSNNVNTSNANDLLYGLEVDGSSGSAASGWTTRSTLDGDVAADRNASSTGSYAFTGTSGGASLAWVAGFH